MAQHLHDGRRPAPCWEHLLWGAPFMFFDIDHNIVREQIHHGTVLIDGVASGRNATHLLAQWFQ
jgi:hypothetical protein